MIFIIINLFINFNIIEYKYIQMLLFNTIVFRNYIYILIWIGFNSLKFSYDDTSY